MRRTHLDAMRCRVLALGAWILCAALPAPAATFVVTRFDDPVGAPCGPDDCSLRGAVIASNNAAGADLVVLPAGTYVVSIPGFAEQYAATGDLDVRDELVIQGAGQELTRVRMANQADRVFDVIQYLSPPSALSLNDLSVSEGYAGLEGTFFSGKGGCIQGGPLNLSNVTVSGCSSAQDAGAIIGGAGTWQHVRIENNKSVGVGGAYISTAPGGVIHDLVVRGNTSTTTVQGVQYPFVPPFSVGGLVLHVDPASAVDDVTLDSNNSYWCGGGRLFFSAGTTSLSRFVVTGNSARNYGGGLCLSNYYTDVAIELHDFAILDNHADRGGGGLDVIHFENAGGPKHAYAVRLYDSAIGGNTAGLMPYPGSGGGIRFRACTTCVGAAVQSIALIDSKLTGNIAQYAGDGGGIYSDVTVGLLRSRISANRAENSGGALYLPLGAGTYSTIVDTTVDANSAGGVGGAIYAKGTVPAAFLSAMQVRNSTFYANTASGGGVAFVEGTYVRFSNATLKAAPKAPPAAGTILWSNYFSTISLVNSIVSGTCAGAAVTGNVRDVESPGNTCGFGGTSYFNIASSQLALGPLQGNGGPTPTLMPAAGSLAIDHGDNTQCQSYDQRGYFRPHVLGNPCDIGAVEANGLPVIAQ